MSEPRSRRGGRTSASKRSDERRNIVGNQIRLARRQNEPKLSQADLAARTTALGVPLDRYAIGKIERLEREVSDYELKAIGEALNVAVSWLITENETL